MEPLRYDGKVAVFSTRQVDLFGGPELYGFEEYIVVVESQDRVVFGLDFPTTAKRSWRAVHRYSRVERFKTVLLDLVGGRGTVPKEVLDTVKYWGIDEREKKAWNSVRFILRVYGWKKYYNKIPDILKAMGMVREEIRSDQLDEIMCRFKALSSQFERMKNILGRKYFPDLRYIALRLLEEVGVTSSFDAVKLKTRRKLKEYELVYDLLK
jgi:hypothetical protein